MEFFVTSVDNDSILINKLKKEVIRIDKLKNIKIIEEKITVDGNYITWDKNQWKRMLRRGRSSIEGKLTKEDINKIRERLQEISKKLKIDLEQIEADEIRVTNISDLLEMGAKKIDTTYKIYKLELSENLNASYIGELDAEHKDIVDHFKNSRNYSVEAIDIYETKEGKKIYFSRNY